MSESERPVVYSEEFEIERKNREGMAEKIPLSLKVERGHTSLYFIFLREGEFAARFRLEKIYGKKELHLSEGFSKDIGASRNLLIALLKKTASIAKNQFRAKKIFTDLDMRSAEMEIVKRAGFKLAKLRNIKNLPLRFAPKMPQIQSRVKRLK